MASRRKNGVLDVFKTRETVYPMRRYSKPALGRAPGGVETRYLGAIIRRLEGGDYATSLDWDSRFDSLRDVRAFIKSWRAGRANPLISITSHPDFKSLSPQSQAAVLTVSKLAGKSILKGKR